MRPYRRRHHSSWRTRRGRGPLKGLTEYLKPFLYSTRSMWKLGPPFPLTAKIFITAMTWFLLLLPLCYFLVPPLATLFLLNYFSERISLDSYLSLLGELCAGSTWPKKIPLVVKYFHKVLVVFFLYDYYQIIRCLRVG